MTANQPNSSVTDLQEQLKRQSRELDEAREERAAIADVLRIISNSRGELEAVFQTILMSAVRICGAKLGDLYLREADGFRMAASHNAPPAYVEARTREPVLRPPPDAPLGRLAATKQLVQIADIKTIPSYIEGHPFVRAAVDLAGYRTVLVVPMLKDDQLIGAIGITRQEIQPFTDRQIALVQNFAAQAVIAIENARLLNELRHSLEQQTATADVLRVISSSPGELEPAFRTMLEKATRICEAKFGVLYLVDGEMLAVGAEVGTPPEYAEFQRLRGRFQPTHGGYLERVLRTKQTSYTADVAAENVNLPVATVGGARSLVCVPMLRDDAIVGVIAIYRQEVRPFTDKQIELLTNFAAQAVIAIENTRLLNELRESLQQQTATADVLKVISRSTFDLETVFDTLLESAVRLCEAESAHIFRHSDGLYEMAACRGYSREYQERVGHYRLAPGRESLVGRIALEGRVVHIPDVLADSEYNQPEQQRLGQWRTMLGVPLLREGIAKGALTVSRSTVRPFNDKQIELLTTFADQAVIAIENTRLLNELRESLQQQTATADVLKVISRSTFDLQTVLNTLVESAARLCDADMANIWRPRDGVYRLTASYGVPSRYRIYQENKNFLETQAIVPSRDTVVGRTLLEGKTIHVHDVQADPDYRSSGIIALGGYRTMLGVPLLREGELIGVIALTQSTVRPFTDKQIELVQTFADQAVIAIENVRLFEAEQQRTRELSESLEQQTATSDVLRVISSSTGDPMPVFEAMLQNAVRICGAEFGNLLLREGDTLRIGATHGAPAAYVDFVRREGPFRVDPRLGLGRMLETRQTYQVADIAAAATHDDKLRVATIELAGARTVLGVPMLKNGEMVGCTVIYRREVRPFTAKQIELVQNFAAQAVIAIENARLLNELRQRTDDLTESLEQQTATSKVLEVISRSAFDLRAVFETVAESSVRLCGADRAFIFRFDGELLRMAVAYNSPPEFTAWVEQHPIRPGRHSGSARAALERRTIHIPDVRADPEYTYGAKDAEAIRTVLGVPILKGDDLLGVMMIYHLEGVRPFTEKQIALVETFADQAAIAIENARLFEAEQQRTRELSESLEQQTATLEVLKVISSSPGELQPVFNAMLENATRICEAKVGNLFLCDGEDFRAVAVHGESHYADWFRRDPMARMQRQSHTPLARLVRTKQVIHIPDLRQDQSYIDGNDRIISMVETAGARTHLVVPMLKDRELVGAIVIYRQEVRPFTDKQIELVQNFAAQAVIAIESTRLLNELRESLDQQTATADVLRVISSSTGDLQPVFDAMLANATRLCEASYGTLWLHEGDGQIRAAALHGGLPDVYLKTWGVGTVFRPKPSVPSARAMSSRKPVQLVDLKEDESYLDGDPLAVAAVDLAGIRTIISVPMVKDEVAIGAMTIYRREVRPFTVKQTELVGNFAAQAVIAIENARLLNELRESLQQQTATADVLKVISRSAFDLHTVLDTLLKSAARLCDADQGTITQRKGDTFFRTVSHGFPPAFLDFVKDLPVEPGRETGTGRALAEGQVIHIPDVLVDPDYTWGEAQQLGGFRTLLGVPMLRDGVSVGVLTLTRSGDVRPFTAKQIELVSTFADQAAIAIENVRLFEAEQQRTRELSDLLEQQTATSEVLKVISSSPGELAPVFEAILTNATQICEAEFGTLTQVVDGIPRLMFQLNVPAALEEFWRRETLRPSSHNAISRVITTGQAVHVTDLQAYEAYIDGDPLAVAGVELGGIRTLLVVPMLKDQTTFGTIGIYRQEVRPFTDKQIELVSNFAAQAAIAIENTRLINELRQRTDDLSKSLDDLRAAQDRLVQTEKLASLGQLTAGIAHEIKNPLNFVNNFSGVSVELIDELQEALEQVAADEKTRADITELSDTLRDNLRKIVQHGKRADSIVKNMLLHSRQGSGERRLTDVNALVEDSLNLAYHGARAEKPGFNITLQRSFDPAAGEIEVFPQEITRVLLNLIGNGFYAATKRQGRSGEGFEPTLAAATKSLGDRVEICIRDNGTGIPPEVKEKMFNPFFTTKPAGEGTGLGLSLSHDIIVKQHSGSIEVDTEPGRFTEFRIVLPRTAAKLSPH